MRQPVVKGALLECDECGVQRVMLDRMVLRVGVHDLRAAVRFRCDECGRVWLRRIDRDQAAGLVEANITIEWWEPSHEHDEQPDGPTLDETDLAAWCAVLDDDVHFDHVVASLCVIEELG
jgi:uncharacterized Zn finger protein